MPKDNNRLDLHADLDKLSHDFLKDIEAATKEVTERKQADAAKDRRNLTKKKDRRTSIIVIAAAAVVLILIAWAVMAKEPQQASSTAYVPPQRLNPAIQTPSRSGAGMGQRPAAPRLAPPPPARNQQTQAPSNEYQNEPM